MSAKIWQPEHPTPGWLQAERDSDLMVYLPLEKDLVVPLHFRRIPAGIFRMGSRGKYDDEKPIHFVRIPEAFYLGIFPVTQMQYRALASAFQNSLARIADNEGVTPSHFTGDLRPVEQVSWDDAMALCGALSNAEFFQEGLLQNALVPTTWQVSLPSEGMWEYACRAGAVTDYWNGDGEATLTEVGWYRDNSGNETHPVGGFPANAWGLYDMHGNVWEWCADFYDAKAYRKRSDGWLTAAWSEDECGKDAEGSQGARVLVLRGGSWLYAAKYCRSACRDRRWSGLRDRNGGFRLCVFRSSGDLNHEPEVTAKAEPPGAASSVDLAQVNFSAVVLPER